ncbi:MAG: hypothetical protein WAM01_05635 [Candidatus Acidiferrales bacterium]
MGEKKSSGNSVATRREARHEILVPAWILAPPQYGAAIERAAAGTETPAPRSYIPSPF